MRRSYLLLFILMLTGMTLGLTSCSSDDDEGVGNIDLPTPPYESVSGKYEITSSSSPYESIELGASGNYIVTLGYGGYSAGAAYGAGARKSLLSSGRGSSATRATEDGNYIYGTFTSLGNDEYALEGFGTIKLSYSGDQVTGIEITTGGATQTYTVHKAATAGDDNITNALCRTWKIERVRSVITDKETGEKHEETATPDNTGDYGTEFPIEAVFSKSGTYLIAYLDGTLSIAEWKWKDRGAGTLYYAWEGEWTGEYATITFSGNTAVVHDVIDDEYTYEENWTYLVTEDVPADTPDTDLPEGQSPLDNVFTGKLLKELDGEQFTYNNGFLTQIAGDNLTITYHYNYATGTEGSDVYVRMDDNGDIDEFEVTLNSQGFAQKVVQRSGDNVYTKTFEYDADGHLTAMNDDRNEREYTLTWAGGDLTKVYWRSTDGDEYTYTYTYGDKLNSNCLLFYYTTYDVDIDEVQYLYYAGLLGTAPLHLAETSTSDTGQVTTFTWTDNSYTADYGQSEVYPTYFSFYD